MVVLYLFIVGACVGSFLNVLVDRLPIGKSIMGRSECDFCHHKLAWIDLIPLFSYLFLGKKCRYCHKKISGSYSLGELLTAVMFVLSWIYLPSQEIIIKIIYLGIISCLIVIFLTDSKYRIIPDQMQIVFFILSFFLIFFQGASLRLLVAHILSGLIIMLPILLLYLITKGKGMGFGDVKLAFNIGFFLGIKAGFMSLYFAFIIGSLVGVALMIAGRKKFKSKIAFGPFLVIGILILIFFKDPIFSFISRVYGF